MTYHELIEAALTLYEEGKYEEGLRLLDEKGPHVNGIEAQIDNFRYCFAAKAGLVDEAMDIFETAIRQKGFWYNTAQLEEDEDLDAIRGTIEFQALLEANRRRESEYKTLRKSTNILIEGTSNRGWIILHGNHENIAIIQPQWELECIENDTRLFIQSSLPDFTDAYHWDSMDIALQDTLPHIQKTMEKYEHINEWYVIGFSAGASVALELLINTTIVLSGGILLSPWLPELERQQKHIEQIAEPIYMLIGENDQSCLPSADALALQLSNHGLPFVDERVPSLGHVLPDELEKFVSSAIRFLNSN